MHQDQIGILARLLGDPEQTGPNRGPDFLAIPETVGDRLGDAEDLHENILDVHGQDLVGEKCLREPHDPHLRPSLLRHPVPASRPQPIGVDEGWLRLRIIRIALIHDYCEFMIAHELLRAAC